MAISSTEKNKESGTVIGQMVTGKGIYLGIWKPKCYQGMPFHKTFDLYAAPTDLLDEKGRRHLLTYDRAVKKVSELTDWNGHNGVSIRDDRYIDSMIRGGEADKLSNWFIPTREILNGRSMLDNMLPTNFYWSSTGYSLTASLIYIVNAELRRGFWENIHDKMRCATRPVRAELRLKS